METNIYKEYIKEIEERKGQGLHPKPIDDANLLKAIVAQIKDVTNENRQDSLSFFIYNTLPGTTSAAVEKANFLKEIILGESLVAEITSEFAFEQLSHMKGGPSIKVLLDIALGSNETIARNATDVLKTQVFLYESDTSRLKNAFEQGNKYAKELIESYANAEFFTKLPEIEEEIDVVTFIAGVGDVFKYNFNLYSNVVDGFLQGQFKFNKVDF